MSELTHRQIKFIDAQALWRRVALLVPVLLILTGGWFAARWLIGNTIAEHPPDIETARAATRLAPDDPQTHFTLAVFNRDSFLPQEIDEALRKYAQATSRSPNDYRLWLELGRERAKAGDLEGGEQALRRAVELAPAYAYPRWHLGNVLLRQGRQTEAFAELKRAGVDESLRAQVWNLAWRFYGEDVDQVMAAVGDSAAVRAELVVTLANQKRLEDALRFWSSLNADEKREQRRTGEVLLIALASAGRFQSALRIQREIAVDGAPELAVGRIVNGGFEENINKAGESLFGWQVPPGGQTQVAIDARSGYGGARSLRIVFFETMSAQFRGISQLITVEPQASYRLGFRVRTDDLKSASTLFTEVVDSTNPARVLAASSELPNGTMDWQFVTLQFTVPAQTEAITLRLTRRDCGNSTCPIFGKVWYDDFDLQRSSSGGRAATPGRTGDAGSASVERPGER